MNVDQYMQELGIAARTASHVVAASPPAVRNRALLAMHDALDGARAALAQANAVDMEQGRAKALDAPLLDRLELTPARIDAMLEGLRQALSNSRIRGQTLRASAQDGSIAGFEA